MLLRDSTNRSVEFHLFSSSGVDFAEDWLNAGCLPRDADGAYLVGSVALRKESVDRNWPAMILPQSRLPSLSARRAWIEISGINCKTAETAVALRKESVDRNCAWVQGYCERPSRSPQGERG